MLRRYSILISYREFSVAFNDCILDGSDRRQVFASAAFIEHSLDINRYVVEKALGGLFYMVGQEDRKIRTNPAAQVTVATLRIYIHD